MLPTDRLSTTDEGRVQLLDGAEEKARHEALGGLATIPWRVASPFCAFDAVMATWKAGPNATVPGCVAVSARS